MAVQECLCEDLGRVKLVERVIGSILGFVCLAGKTVITIYHTYRGSNVYYSL